MEKTEIQHRGCIISLEWEKDNEAADALIDLELWAEANLFGKGTPWTLHRLIVGENREDIERQAKTNLDQILSALGDEDLIYQE